MSKKFSAARRNAFLKALGESGNQTLSAERAKVSRSWVCLQRSTDAEFDAACRVAIELAKERLRQPSPSPSLQGGRGQWRYLGGHELVVRGTGGSGGGKRVQVARARLKQWTPRVEQRFLEVLAATCNAKVACAEAGMSIGSAYAHRRRRPEFARNWDVAIEIGYIRLESSIHENIAYFFDPDMPPPEAAMKDVCVMDAIRLLRMYDRRRK